MTARVPLLRGDDLRRAAEAAGIDPKYLTQPIWAALLVRPKLARAVYAVLTDLLFRGTLEARLRELMIMRMGWATGSEFEWAQHWLVAQAAGVPADDVVAVRTWDSAPGFDERDRAALAAVDDVVREGAVSATTWAALTRHFEAPQLLEVVAVAGTWLWMSVLLRSLEIPLDDGMEPWPPDGVGPGGPLAR